MFYLIKSNEIIDRIAYSDLLKEMFINSLSVNIEFDREVAEQYRINISGLGNTIQTIIGECVVTYYDM